VKLSTDGFLVLAGRNERALSDVWQRIERAGAKAVPLAADVTSAEGQARIVDGAPRRRGGIDAPRQRVAIIASGGPVETDDAGWDAMMDVNVRRRFPLIRQGGLSLAERRGAVVNVSSVTGLRAFPNVFAYCISKAAVDQLTRCAALDLAPRGVRVNAVNPGVVVTNLHRRSGMDDTKYASFLERSTTTHPLGRTGTPEEIADLIAFLVSPSSAWMTGDTIGIDGGRHLTCLR
jgi:NAD(P)-dependent dehydrogenase (short-subunit alcohol dehydrogenase family)